MIEAGKTHSFFGVKLLLIVLLLVPSTGISESARLVIFHTSDIHGNIAAQADPTSKEDEKPLMGGFAVFKKLMDTYKSKPELQDARFFYFDSGDYFQGTPIVDRTKGEVMISFLNAVGLDATTIGNHEFDYSYHILKDKMRLRRFPVICSNVLEKKNGKLVAFAEPYHIFAHKGFKIGVLGIDAPNTPSISIYENIKELSFIDPVPVIKKQVKMLRHAGVDFIILLSHLGHEADLQFVKQVKDIDLILGGHSHTLLTSLTLEGPWKTPVVHSGAHLHHTSRLKITLNSTGDHQIDFKSYPLYLDELGEDEEIKQLEDEYLKELRAEMSRVIGYTEVNLFRGVNGGDSPEGSFIADAMRKASGADLAFINFGGIRQPIFKGELTVENIFVVQPFNNVIEIVNMTGSQIIDLLERSVSNTFVPMSEADKQYAYEHFSIRAQGMKRVVGPDYGYLYPSNLTFSFDPKKPPMQRIVKATLSDGNKLDMEKVYKVALNDFIAAGGDGFDNMKAYKDRQKTDILVRDSVINYIEELQIVKEKPEQRIFNLQLKEESQD